MLLAFGWAHIQSAKNAYAVLGHDDSMALEAEDARRRSEDRILFSNLRAWFDACEPNSLEWNFFEDKNYDSGLLQFCDTKNHRTSLIWDLMSFIASESRGSYGLVYVHDNEDTGKRTSTDYSQSYRAWRILDGHVSEHDDPHFSPFSVKSAFELP